MNNHILSIGSAEFLELTDQERGIISDQFTRHPGDNNVGAVAVLAYTNKAEGALEVAYQTTEDYTFTVCYLLCKGCDLRVGVAKRLTYDGGERGADEHDPTVARNIALARACRAAPIHII